MIPDAHPLSSPVIHPTPKQELRLLRLQRFPKMHVTAGVCFALALSVLARAQVPADFITFEVPGAQFTSPASINDSDEIAGWSSRSSYSLNARGFVRDRCGVLHSFAAPGATSTLIQFPQTLDQAGDAVGNWYGPHVGPAAFERTRDGRIFVGVLPGAASTDITSINDLGEVLGAYSNADGTSGQFVRDGFGGVHRFRLSGAAVVLTQAINNQGTSVGSWTAEPDSTAYHGFVRYRSGRIVTFDVPTASATYTAGINHHDVITGPWMDASGTSHGYVRHADGSIDTFDVPGAASTNPTSINDRGEIAGTFTNGSFDDHGFVRDADGTVTTFDGPDAVLTIAAAINAQGDITGEYYDNANGLHGFLWRRSGWRRREGCSNR